MTNPIRTGEFIIFVKTTDKNGNPITKYYGRDSYSGGYGYFSTCLSAAAVFASSHAAYDRLNESDFLKNTIMADGTSFPPRMIHDALGLDNTFTHNHGLLCVAEIQHHVVRDMRIETDLHPIPKDIKAAALAKLTPEERKVLGF